VFGVLQLDAFHLPRHVLLVVLRRAHLRAQLCRLLLERRHAAPVERR
jgi:hypothetical protein